MSSSLLKALSWIVTLLVPVVLVLAAVRLLMTPLFLIVEYNTPGFPQDRYGFTKEDRLYWSGIALEYLLNSEDISFLAELHFPAGESAPQQTCQFMDDCTRLYNDRELRHMEDVKNVVQASLMVLYVSSVVLLVLGIWAWRGDWWLEFRRGLARGGWLTVIFIALILLFVLVAFGIIFVAFHNVFFDPGTWTFLFSDTLIRLFPERFWRDTFLAVGLFSVGAGLALGYLFREKTT
jgi:integral membrane protein (TIGR01906 family)